VVLKLTLLAFHMAPTLIDNLRQALECSVMVVKQRHQTLHVALFNLYYVFSGVFVKSIKWCIVPHIIVKVGLPVDGVCTHSPKTRLLFAIGCETWKECSGSQLAIPSSAGYTLRNGGSLFRRLLHDQLNMTRIVSVGVTKNVILTIFDKQVDAQTNQQFDGAT